MLENFAEPEPGLLQQGSSPFRKWRGKDDQQFVLTLLAPPGVLGKTLAAVHAPSLLMRLTACAACASRFF
jgi:hypothetical protein